MMTKKKGFAIILIFLLTITGIRLTWMHVQRTIDHPIAVDGILDLRGWKLPQNETIRLDGEWTFYPSQLVSPDDLSADTQNTVPQQTIQVPGDWKSAFSDQPGASFRVGTYRLRMWMSDDQANQRENVLKMRIGDMSRASAIYVNGKLLGGLGTPADTTDHYKPDNRPYSVTLPSDTTHYDIVIHVSNHTSRGGIVKSIRLGTEQAIDARTTLSISLQLGLCVVFLVHALYALMLYFMRAGNRGLLYFALLLICAIISVLVADDKLLYHLVPLPYEAKIKLFIWSYVGVVSFMPLLIKHMFSDKIGEKALRWFSGFTLTYAVSVIFTPSQYSLALTPVFINAIFIISVVLTAYMLRIMMKKDPDAVYLLLACASIGVNIAWTTLRPAAWNDMIHYPFDLLVTALAFAAFWFKRFFRANAETKQLAQRLQLANEQKDDFLVNTSHELRNPLHGMINITQSVLEDRITPIDERHRSRLETQLTVAKRMAVLLDDLLDVTRLKENAIQLQLRPVPIQSVAVGVAEMLKYMLDGKHIELVIDIDDDFPAVKADENRLIQILFNLLHNAVKFTVEGRIFVYVEKDDRVAHIHVEDTGVGIDEETKQKIFEPYVRGGQKWAEDGIGIGLSICKQLVELHGGALGVDSTIGKGTVFTVTLPLWQDTLPVVDDEKVTTSRSRKETAAAMENRADLNTPDQNHQINQLSDQIKPRILIVDDDTVNLNVLLEVLGSEKYDITSVTTGSEAIAELETNHFDLVISDVMMPNMSGYALTDHIRKRFSISELPILLLTARNRLEDKLAGFQSGANDYVVKPVDAWELRSRVRAWTELQLSIKQRLQIEAAWLQAQIQPHFLFNTLNSIAALGTIDTKEMLDLLDQFSQYLRMSFDFHNQDQVISVHRELELVQSYLYIEKVRFGDRLHMHWEVDKDIHFSVPPVSIQTLVENAINHGILSRGSGGTLTIRLADVGDHFEVCIVDDGVGMSEEHIERALDESAGVGKGRGIGLRNTNRRLKQLYGRGIQIVSAPGKGTTVCFHIPKSKE